VGSCMRDTEGKEITEGCWVVFNQSGYLYRGRVVKIHRCDGRFTRGEHIFHIAKNGSDKVSKVKEPRCIFVL
jgi:hypothetical protein